MQHCYAQDNLPTYLNSVVRHIALYRFTKTKFIAQSTCSKEIIRKLNELHHLV